MRKRIRIVALLFVLLGTFHGQAQHALSIATLKNMTVQDEKNNILALAAADYVFQDWQQEGKSPRGYNVGAVLYDEQADTIIGMYRNSVNKENDKTQHAEMGLMQGYLHKRFCKSPHNTMQGLQIVTTLEPCMMCAGMMAFLELDTVKYIQTDPLFGKNIERLSQDWTDQEGVRHPANERCTRIKSVSLDNTTYLAAFLNKGYEKYAALNPGKSMAEYLMTARARKIYESADLLLKQWHLMYVENGKLLNSAKKKLGLTCRNETTPSSSSANYDLFLKMWNSIE